MSVLQHPPDHPGGRRPRDVGDIAVGGDPPGGDAGDHGPHLLDDHRVEDLGIHRSSLAEELAQQRTDFRRPLQVQHVSTVHLTHGQVGAEPVLQRGHEFR